MWSGWCPHRRGGHIKQACTPPVFAHAPVHTYPCSHTGGWWQPSRGWSDVPTAEGLPHHQRQEGAGPSSPTPHGRASLPALGSAELRERFSAAASAAVVSA